MWWSENRDLECLVRWWEPWVFARKESAKAFRSMMPVFIRAPVWGLLFAAALDYFFLPSPELSRAKLYLTGLLAGDAVILLVCVQVLIPRWVWIRRSRISVQHGQHVFGVAFSSVETWHVRRLQGKLGLWILSVRYKDRRGRHRRLTVGLPSWLEPKRPDYPKSGSIDAGQLLASMRDVVVKP